jgi:hypothetical protein
MHQDHGQSPDVCRSAIDLGFSSVMMDGSLEADGKTIASYDYNVDVTKKVVDWRTRAASRSRASSAASARSRRCAATRKTATAPSRR